MAISIAPAEEVADMVEANVAVARMIFEQELDAIEKGMCVKEGVVAGAREKLKEGSKMALEEVWDPNQDGMLVKEGRVRKAKEGVVEGAREGRRMGVR